MKPEARVALRPGKRDRQPGRGNIKFLFISATLVAAIAPAFAADVAVPAGLSPPHFYGRINISGYPQPKLIYSQPIVARRVSLSRQPIYLHVAPGHAQNWRKHCHAYDACGERVYFVQDSWYKREFVPRYLERYRERQNGRYEGQKSNGKATIKTMITAAGEFV